MPSREFAKKNAQMSIQLAIDATGFREKGCGRKRFDLRANRLRAARRGRCARDGTGDRVERSKRVECTRTGRRRLEAQVHPRPRRGRDSNRTPGAGRRNMLADGRIVSETAASPNRPETRRASRREDGLLYFLCRARFSSFRCLCFRIFLRRFLITLPTGCLRAPRLQRQSVREDSPGRLERGRPSR